MGPDLLPEKCHRPPLAWYGLSWAYDRPEPEAVSLRPGPDVGGRGPREEFDQASFGAERPPGRGIGVILGRFLPPHRGHQYLVDFARGITDDLHLFLRVSDDDPIPGDDRTGWLRELFPGVDIVPVRDPGPDSGDVRRAWAALVLRHVGRADYLFGSEPHGGELAERLGAHYIPVDPERRVVAASGSQIRADPQAHWDDLPPCVRPAYVSRVCLIGPEASGKSSLARKLAERHDTVVVPEYARVLEHARGPGWTWTPGDTQDIARGQLAAEAAMARRANRILFCDTDLLQVRLWSERLFGRSPAWVGAESRRLPARLYLVMDADLPFVGDPGRDRPEERRAFVDRCLSELASRGLPLVKIGGSWRKRLATAREAVRAFVHREA